MKKRAAYNILTLLFFNLLFWVCNLYPKHIIEFGYAGLSVRATVLNLLYYILYFGFFAIFVFKGQGLTHLFYGIFSEVIGKKLFYRIIIKAHLCPLTCQRAKALFPYQNSRFPLDPFHHKRSILWLPYFRDQWI